MRLVACTRCHTQYDVSDVDLERFACRCGCEIENRDLEAVDAKILRCGSCGAIVADPAEHCDYCGSSIERDPGRLSLICPECYARCAEDARFCTACGVTFQPEELELGGRELPCPGCGALMPIHRVGPIAVNECTGCHGLWVPGDSFDRLVARAVEARRGANPTERVALDPRVRGANPAAQQIRYRACPECQAFMQRRNFRKSSGVILDVCYEHGTWLDADELEQIAGFILSGGETSPTFREPGFQQRRAGAEFARIQQTWAPRRDPGEGPISGSLLDVLTRLLS